MPGITSATTTTTSTTSQTRWARKTAMKRRSGKKTRKINGRKERWNRKRRWGERTILLFQRWKLKSEQRHLPAFNRKPQHKQTFRNVLHSLDQNFICSIWYVLTSTTHRRQRQRQRKRCNRSVRCSLLFFFIPLSSVFSVHLKWRCVKESVCVSVCLHGMACNVCTKRYSQKFADNNAPDGRLSLNLWNVCRHRCRYRSVVVGERFACRYAADAFVIALTAILSLCTAMLIPCLLAHHWTIFVWSSAAAAPSHHHWSSRSLAFSLYRHCWLLLLSRHLTSTCNDILSIFPALQPGSTREIESEWDVDENAMTKMPLLHRQTMTSSNSSDRRKLRTEKKQPRSSQRNISFESRLSFNFFFSRST